MPIRGALWASPWPKRWPPYTRAVPWRWPCSRSASEPGETCHHSDRGIQYCSREYLDALAPFHIQVSMTENSDPLENAIAERINSILKQEYLSQQPVYSLREAEQHLEKAVFLYNYKRPI